MVRMIWETHHDVTIRLIVSSDGEVPLFSVIVRSSLPAVVAMDDRLATRLARDVGWRMGRFHVGERETEEQVALRHRCSGSFS